MVACSAYLHYRFSIIRRLSKTVWVFPIVYLLSIAWRFSKRLWALFPPFFQQKSAFSVQCPKASFISKSSRKKRKNQRLFSSSGAIQAFHSCSFQSRPTVLYVVLTVGKRGSPGVTVVDTPGFNSSLQQMEDMVWLLAEVSPVSLPY